MSGSSSTTAPSERRGARIAPDAGPAPAAPEVADLAGASERRERLDLVMPVHNEASVVEDVLREAVDVLSSIVDVRLVVCEDGSTDRTPEILASLESHLPLDLITSRTRKGYAAAVLDGLRRSRAPFVLACDSDGQCDPRSFAGLWSQRDRADLVYGRRTRRRDVLARRTLSRGFWIVYKALFSVPLHDPSCPFVLMRRETLAPILSTLGTMEVGLWWELAARAHGEGMRLCEVPIHHRPRRAGGSQAIPFRAMPRVAVTHTRALLRLWRSMEVAPSRS